jgi:hypothetical protein
MDFYFFPFFLQKSAAPFAIVAARKKNPLRRLLWSRQEKKIHCAVCYSRGKKKKSAAPFAMVAARKKNPLRRLL